MGRWYITNTFALDLSQVLCVDREHSEGGPAYKMSVVFRCGKVRSFMAKDGAYTNLILALSASEQPLADAARRTYG